MNNNYAPVAPFTVTSSSSLSQDVLMSSNILVDSESATPLAMLINPSSNGKPGNPQTEALGIINLTTGIQLCHITRISSNECGWQLNPLFPGITPLEVAAGTNRSGSSSAEVYTFFTDAEHLYYATLQSDVNQWSSLSQINIPAYKGMLNLKVTYSPLGTMVIYGNTSDGNLITLYTNLSAAPTPQICNLDGVLLSDSYQLCMTDESNWYLTVCENGEPVLYSGTLSSNNYESKNTVSVFQGQLGSVLLGYWSHAAEESTSAIWLFVNTSQQLQIWSMSGNDATGQLISAGENSISEAKGYVSLDGTLHIFFVDNTAAQGLWVLHQYPGANGWDSNNIPQFAPAIPIDAGISNLVCDALARETASFFAVNANDYSLRLHAQDAQTQLWQSYTLSTPDTATYEVSRFRTELNLIDANGIPVSNYEVTLNVSAGYSASDFAIAGAAVGIGTDPVTLTTDFSGKMTLAMLATNISAPQMELSATGLTTSFTFQPATALHTYLSGNSNDYNATNPNGALPVFDTAGQTLQNATTPNGTPLCTPPDGASLAVAAQAISTTGAVALNNNSPGANIAGFYISAPGFGNHTYRAFQTIGDLEDFKRQQLLGNVASLDSFWNDIEIFFGDILEGIKNGAMVIKDAVVSLADQIATFSLKIGNYIATGIKISIAGLEKAANFIVGVFQWIGTTLENVVEWLKALFDFGAIMQTAAVFKDCILAAPESIKKQVSTWNFDLDNWFTKQENTVNQAFESFKSAYSEQTFSGLPNYYSPGSSSNPTIKNASLSDFSTNVHHNWLMEKVINNAGNNSPVSPSGATPTWERFATLLDNSAGDFVQALTNLAKGLSAIMQDPNSFANVAIPDFITAIQDLTTALLSLCNAITTGFFAMVDELMDALLALLNIAIPIPPLQALWSYISGSNEPLTLASLFSLLAAFPATIIYKLLMGVNEVPFPNGSPYAQQLAPKETSASDSGWPYNTCYIIAGILEIIQVFPDAISDLAGDAPWPVTLFSTVNTGVIFMLTHPPLEDILATVLLIPCGIAIADLMLISKQITAPDNDKVNLLTTASGCLSLIYGVYEDVETNADPEKKAANILSPLPSVFAFLRISKIRDNPDLLGIPILVNCCFDFIGDVGSGASNLIDAVEGNN